VHSDPESLPEACPVQIFSPMWWARSDIDASHSRSRTVRIPNDGAATPTCGTAFRGPGISSGIPRARCRAGPRPSPPYSQQVRMENAGGERAFGSPDQVSASPSNAAVECRHALAILRRPAQFGSCPFRCCLGPERSFLRRVGPWLLFDCASFTADGSPLHQFANYMHSTSPDSWGVG
jgi:hypothetical protein